MSIKPLSPERNLSRYDMRKGFAFVRTPPVGLPTAHPAAGSEAIVCNSREVALIDEIEVNSITNDANTNLTVTLRINGIVCPLHFCGTTDLMRNERMVLRFKGNLVIHPGQTLSAISGNASVSHMFVRFRKKGLTQAIADGDIPGGGSLPQVASTNTVAGAGTAAGVAKQIVPPVAGKSIEILSMVFTGHNYNAASDNIRLGFWDGTTGTFAANGATIMRAFRMGATARYAQPLIIGNTDGCIQGPTASGVYIQATANMAGATPTADWIIVYRYVPENRVTVVSTTGTAGATATKRGKFWVTTEAAVATSVLDYQQDRFFAASAGNDMLIKMKGWAQSATVVADAAPQIIGFGLGTGTGTPITTATGWGGYMTLWTDGSAGPNPAGHLAGMDDTLLVANMSRIPSFLAYQLTATPTIQARCQLAWGRIEGATLEAQDTVGQSAYRFFV